ncbi:MAG: polysaccharide biosynthesis protein [Chlorobiaceae bacterium]|nr:polysaccharide biosynthesis protein [Chlorobiaceae bacterium]
MQKSILALPCSAKRIIAFTFDVWSALLTVWLAIEFIAEIWHGPTGNHWFLYLIAPGIMLPVFFASGIYRAVYRYSGFALFVTVVRAAVFYGVMFFAVVLLLDFPGVPHLVGILQPMMFLLMTGGSRALVRFWFAEPARQKNREVASNRLLIYGAGKAGTEIARALHQSNRFVLAGYLDDDRELHGRTINGLPVFNPADAESLISNRSIKTVLVAMPSARRARRNEIVRSFRHYPIDIKTLPGIEEIANGRIAISDIKEVDIEDLLGRDPVPVDQALVERTIAGRVVMVTGAGGSIGSELCRQILAARPSTLLLVDNSEYNLYNIHGDLENRLVRTGSCTTVVPLLCDVADPLRFHEICRVFMPSVVYHAAAYKHVPMVEYNPLEGIRNNVLGTLNVVEATLKYGVSSVVLISTDKAVRPTNIMGASKRLCEMILQAYAGENLNSTCFSMVRFGNVLGSSGSVVPLFRNQIKNGGPVTITHEDITRYFMTIPEAARLVIQAGAMSLGGDVFLLEMGNPVKIIDLARRMIELSGLSVRDENNPDGDIEISVTGLRPGEKLYEELLIGDNPEATANPRIFRATEHFIPLDILRSDLKILVKAVQCNNVMLAKQVLNKVVREYRTTDDTVDFLFMEEHRPITTIEINEDKTTVKPEVVLRLKLERSANRVDRCQDERFINDELPTVEHV